MDGCTLPGLQIVFLRNVIALLPVAVYILRGPGWAAMRTDRLPALLGRSLLSLIAIALLTLALGRMQLAEATAVLFVAPLFVTALSVPLLAERVGVHRWAAVLFGFAGVLIMIRPGAGVLGFGAVLAARLGIVLCTYHDCHSIPQPHGKHGCNRGLQSNRNGRCDRCVHAGPMGYSDTG